MHAHGVGPVGADRQRAGNINRVLRQWTVEIDFALATFARCFGAVDEGEKIGFRLAHDYARVACLRARLENEVNHVVFLTERGHLRAVGVLQIVPRPARSEGRPAKKTFVTDEITLDPFDAGGHQGRHERIK